MYKPCKYIHVLLQSVNVDAVIFTSYGKINKVYELPLTLKNDNDSNAAAAVLAAWRPFPLPSLNEWCSFGGMV